MNYAVIRIKKRQYKVKEGQELLLDKTLDENIDPEVLLLVSDKKVVVGNPVVKGAKVKIKVLEKEIKGDKISVQKYKAKSRYRKKIGFRPRQTKIKIEKISSK
jgi:large subunit ribosomal protein L21